MVVAGEPSGDRHAAGLVRAVEARIGPGGVSWFGYGGSHLRDTGVDLLAGIGEQAAIGPQAALTHLAHYRKSFVRLLEAVRERKPRAAVLVDFPEFNLRLARRLKEMGVPVCYFIAPQVWAWREYRVKQIRRWVDLLLVIFPFEERYFQSRDIRAVYVGNPTAARFFELGVGSAEDPRPIPRIALLPGSRRHEVESMLPIQLAAGAWVSRRRRVELVVVKAPEISREQVETVVNRCQRELRSDVPVRIVEGATERLLAEMDAAIVKSGTSTLESMLAGVPFAMMYRMSWLSWLLLRPLVPRQPFCLANRVAGETVAPEFVQWNARPELIGAWLEHVLSDVREFRRYKERLREAAERLGRCDAYNEAADRILQEGWMHEGVGTSSNSVRFMARDQT